MSKGESKEYRTRLKEITSGDLPPAIKIKPVIMSTRAPISKIRLVRPKR